jgi:hypothetical protein
VADVPSIDDIVKAGRARERKVEVFLGVLLVAGGLAWKLAMANLTGGISVATFGAIGLGIVLIGRGLFGRS